MILASHYALLADAADAFAVGGIIGEPDKSKSVRKRKPRKQKAEAPTSNSGPVEISAQLESAPVTRAEGPTAAEVDETYREVFSTLSMTRTEELLTENNERLDSLLNLLGRWWRWEKAEAAFLHAEVRERKRLDEMEELHRKRLANAGNAGGNGSGSPLDSMFDMLGGDGPDRKRRKKTRTRRTPSAKKAGWFSRAGGAAMSKLSTVGKVGALALTGALGAFGMGKVLEDAAPEPKPEPKQVKADAKPVDVKRAAAEAVDDSADVAKATKAVETKTSLFGKMKGALKFGGLLTAAFAANDAIGIHNNDTLTDQEKDKEYSKLTGSTAGSVIGGTGGAVVGAHVGGVAGAVVGFIVPVLGTAVGAAVGTAVGGVLGSAAGALFGSDVGSDAGEYVYDIVVRDDQVNKDDDEHQVKAKLESDDLEKLAKAAESQGNGGSWWQRLLGIGNNSTPTAGNYTTGMSLPNSGAGASGYGGNRGNVVPRAGQPYQKLDYRADPNYVAGQGVLKSLPMANNQEAQLSKWSSIIEDKAAKHGIDPLLVRSVMKQESGGNQHARSQTGVEGLMQLTNVTAREVGVTDRRDPEQSVDGGANYLAKQIKRFDGSVPLALAAYNGGGGNINKAIRYAGSKDPDKVLAALPNVMEDQAKVREIQQYVQKITRYHQEYQEQAGAIPTEVETPTAEVSRDTTAPEVKVDRTDTSDNIVAQTTAPAPAAPAPAPEPKKEKGGVTRTQGSNYTPPASISRNTESGADPTSLDDMPLLLTDHGIGGILTGRV